MKPLLHWMDFSKIKNEDVAFKKNGEHNILPFSQFISNFFKDESQYDFISREIRIATDPISYLGSDLACFVDVLAHRKASKCMGSASLLPFESKYDGDHCALIISGHGIVADDFIFVPSEMKHFWTAHDNIGLARYWYYEFYKNDKNGRIHAMTPNSKVHYFDKRKLFPELIWENENANN